MSTHREIREHARSKKQPKLGRWSKGHNTLYMICYQDIVYKKL